MPGFIVSVLDHVPDEPGFYTWTNSGDELFAVMSRLGTPLPIKPGRQLNVWVRSEDERDAMQFAPIGSPLPEWWGSEDI